jgi:A/G-specific adenine glycosylase
VNWFKNQPALPWRDESDPYRIWVLETMAQQTTITVVLQRYALWLNEFPTLQSLAIADEVAVLRAWEGLGYYSRARNLHLSAKKLVLYSTLPQTQAEWLTLPGIGLYTANSIMSRAFHQPVLAFDANLNRIFMRLLGIAQLSALQQRQIEQQLLPWLQQISSATINQALMRLGQIHCKKKPICASCPLHTICIAHLTNQTIHIPPTKKRKITPLNSFVLVLSHNHHITLEQRTYGVGRGMFTFPRFTAEQWELFKVSHPTLQLYALPLVVHNYTRYRETLQPFYAETFEFLPLELTVTQHPWASLASLPLLSVYRTIAQHAQKLAYTL